MIKICKIFLLQSILCPIDENAKKRALNLANAEFTQAHSQTKQKTSLEKRSNKKKYFIGALTSFSFAFMAFVLIGYYPPQFLVDSHFSETTSDSIEETEAYVVLKSRQENPSPIVEDKFSGREREVDEEATIELAKSKDVMLADQSLTATLNAPTGPEPVAEQNSESVSNVKEDEIIVTGIRGSLERAMDVKRESQGVVDAISSEDIGKFSDSNLAESLQRITDVEISREPPAGDRFKTYEKNPVKQVTTHPVSTFSIDVDTASYSYVRRQLNNGLLPPQTSVRIEEMINYFDYAYPLPKTKKQPFLTSVTVTESPWNSANQLVRIGIKGYEVKQRAKANLVFLVDVSGSMNEPDKLPLVKQSLRLLINELSSEDSVAMSVYAGAAGTVLPPTSVADKKIILAAIDRLQAGGSTAGAQGIELAYQLAQQHYDNDTINRVILATDGDFNVGITDHESLKALIEKKRQQGIFLSVLGFGEGNYNDALMQTLAQNGNGVAAYIDNFAEAQKVLVDQAKSSLVTIAKDVKIQVEFNPHTVAEYRLIGYESRALNNQDFNNDKIDAGDIGSGHTVTAIYEITPTNSEVKLYDPLRYNETSSDKKDKKLNEYGWLKLRYKLPDQDTSSRIDMIISASEKENDEMLLREHNFASAVAGFAQLLQDNPHINDWGYAQVIDMATRNRGEDLLGYRSEFIQLVRKAKLLSEME